MIDPPTIGHVLGSIWGTWFFYEDDGIGAGVATRHHPLGESSDLVSLGVLPSGPSGLVSNEVAVLQEFYIVS